jgi:AcrR family transcriptional regulator
MDELSHELGISKKTLYQCFPSKDALLDAVMERQFADLGAQVRQIQHSPEDFIERLFRLWTTMGKMACRISRQFQDDLRRHRPDLWERVEEARRTILQEHFSTMIEEGVRRGLVRDDLNKEILVLMYLSSVEGVVNPDVLLDNAFSTEEALTTILRVYLDGILTEKARKQFHSRLSL